MGFDSLVLLPPGSRLALLVMTESHQEDHRGPGDALWRSRRRGYWIVRGRVLAKKITASCLVCRRIKTKMEQQQMADLPREIFKIPVRAFSRIQLDYAGAVMVKDQVKRRTERKCFPLLFCCLNSGGLHIQLATGYSAEEFLIQLQHFSALRGSPVYIHTDMGSQLVSAGKKLKGEPGELPDIPWDEVRASDKTRGIEFVHCPTQSQWRNGRAESAVRAVKNTLKHLTPGHSITYSEYSCLLARAADKVNQRPLGVRHHGGAEAGVCVITPHMLMSGGLVCQGEEHGKALEHDVSKLDFRMRMVEDSFALWWKNWMLQVWESLVPVAKWRTAHRNVKAGDIVIVRYTSKVTKPEFRLGQIKETFADSKGLVRDVIVITRSRRGKPEDLLEYKTRKFDEQKLPVQRLAVLLPVEERDNLPAPDDTLHLCEEDMRMPDLAEVYSRVNPSPTGPTAPTSNVPTSLDSGAEEISEPVELMVNGVQHGYVAAQTDTSEYVNKLVNHSVRLVQAGSQPHHCSECVSRHNLVYHRDSYRDIFQSQENKSEESD